MKGGTIMECVSMYNQAVTFRWAAERCAERRTENDGSIRTLIVPEIVNAALACEIFLKTILEHTGKSLEKKHKLNELYESLDQKDKEKIENMCGAGPLFNEKMVSIGDTFVKWRYFYECDSGSLDVDFLHRLVQVLDDVTKDLLLAR